jgi:DNA-binding NarL/FixJ family response regulator
MRVVIIEDVLLVREGLARLLADHGIDVVATVGDATDIVGLVTRFRPDVMIVDIRLPPTFTDEGLQAVTRVRAETPHVGMLVLSQHLEGAYAWHLIDEAPERVGYLLKDRVSDIGIVVDALNRINDGETVLDPAIVSRVLGRRRQRDPLEALTDREREVLALVAEGMSNRAIARRLVVGERTIESHISSAFMKVGLDESEDANRRVRLVLAWLRAQS